MVISVAIQSLQFLHISSSNLQNSFFVPMCAKAMVNIATRLHLQDIGDPLKAL